MTIFDVSLPISSSMLVWRGVAPVQVSEVASQAKGAVANESMIVMHVHNGTHIDAPLHLIPSGKSIDQIDLETLVGPAWVVDTGDAELSTAEILSRQSIPPGTQRILFHTRNSKEWLKPEPRSFCKTYVAISKDGAEWMVEYGIQLVGVDYLSVAPYDAPAPTHQVFLSAGVILIESLNLSGIAPGGYRLVCLPLKIAGIEGAPVRVILTNEQ